MPPPLTPTTLPHGWTPYASPTWPPDGATVDVLHPDGSVTAGCHYRHWDMFEQPKGWPVRAAVVGWREARATAID
jgi:hypothetical protein